MAERIQFYEIGTDKKCDDFFHLTLSSGKSLWWKNFGQKIISNIDGDKIDIREQLATADGGSWGEETDIVITAEYAKFLEELDLFPWYVNSYKICHTDDLVYIKIEVTKDDVIEIIGNAKWNSRSEELPEQDYYFWEQWEHIGEYAERVGKITDEAISEPIANWRRPKLKTNAPVKMVVLYNDQPKYIGILEKEKKKTVIDASFRLLYALEFINWREIYEP